MQSTADDLCEQELGRWISPFRRRIGRWLTPVREFLPLIAPRPGQAAATCQFKMNTAPWAMPWKPSLQLRCVGCCGGVTGVRLTSPTAPGSRFTDPQPEPGPVPTGYLPLFRGGTFNQSYNNRRWCELLQAWVRSSTSHTASTPAVAAPSRLPLPHLLSR